jgi:hypothetical protein
VGRSRGPPPPPQGAAAAATGTHGGGARVGVASPPESPGRTTRGFGPSQLRLLIPL